MKPIHLLPLILLALFAVVGKSLPQDSYYVEVKSDGLEGPSYAWAIGEDEERRISQLLDYDIRDLDFVGFNMNTVPKICPHCGKETEIYDWFWTALERGIHSKEWLIQSLRSGQLSRKNAHDVYCSRCGHLTVFRDPTGDEGGMHHIAHATPYDRATRTFGKRDAEAAAAQEIPEGTDAGWRTSWLIKKDAASDSVETQGSESKSDMAADSAVPEVGWRPSWLIKKENAPEETSIFESDADVPESDVPEVGWRTSWLIKRENAPEELGSTGTKVADAHALAHESGEPSEDAVGWRPIWLIKKDDMPEELKEPDADVSDVPEVGWRPIWLIKKENAPEELEVTKSEAADAQAVDHNAGEPSEDAVGWRPIWLIKKDDMPEELKDRESL